MQASVSVTSLPEAISTNKFSTRQGSWARGLATLRTGFFMWRLDTSPQSELSEVTDTGGQCVKQPQKMVLKWGCWGLGSRQGCYMWQPKLMTLPPQPSLLGSCPCPLVHSPNISQRELVKIKVGSCHSAAHTSPGDPISLEEMPRPSHGPQAWEDLDLTASPSSSPVTRPLND